MLAYLAGPRVGSLGYGLTFDTGFKQTHLSTQPAPVAAPTESD